MKSLIAAAFLAFSGSSFAQNMADYAGDYTLNFSISACNANAKVEVSGNVITVTNPDPRNDKGWSTTKLTPGTTSKKPNALVEYRRTVTFQGSDVFDKTETFRGGSKIGSVTDQYSFTRKSLKISMAVKTEGNVSGYGTSCGYEKK